MEGCYRDFNREPQDQPRISPSSEKFETGHKLYGLATLPNGSRAACGTVLVREDGGEDWLYFYLPMGALAQVYDVGGYPFDVGVRSHDEWRNPLDNWLAQLGIAVFGAVPYRLGLIGHEVWAFEYVPQMERKSAPPSERYNGYLWPSDGKVEYLPRNSR